MLLTEDAERDLEELYDYLAAHDATGKADHVLSQISKVVSALAEMPKRGSHPKELTALGNREFREVFFKPYRIIYRVMGDRVYVMLIADGRRSLQDYLQLRLLG